MEHIGLLQLEARGIRPAVILARNVKSPVASGIKFCEPCSAKIEQLPVHNAGHPFVPGIKFCDACGTPVGSAGTAPSAAVPVAHYPPVLPLAPIKDVPIKGESPVPSPVSGKRTMIIGGIVGIIILAIIVFLVVLPILSGRELPDLELPDREPAEHYLPP